MKTFRITITANNADDLREAVDGLFETISCNHDLIDDLEPGDDFDGDRVNIKRV